MTKNYQTLLFLVIIGVLLRSVFTLEGFNYGHDNDLISWIFKDMIIDGHPRLIGQQTSALGIFIGGLYYYLTVPFYFLTSFWPHGTTIIAPIQGILTILSSFYVGYKLYGKKAAFISSLIFATSYSIVITEREIVPTSPIFLWSIWFLYGCIGLYRGNKNALYILAILFSLIWHISFGLICLGLIPLIICISNPKIFLIVKQILISIVIFLALSAPLIVFEVKHNFIQVSTIFKMITNSSSSSASIFDNMQNVVAYASKNLYRIFYWTDIGYPYSLMTILIVLVSWIYIKKPREVLLVYLPWLLLTMLFFSYQPLRISEYYLNSLNVIWIFSISSIISQFARTQKTKITLFCIWVLLQFGSYAKWSPQANAYLQRVRLVEDIKNHAKENGYKCVSVSYQTEVGYNLGYRYLFYLNNLHVNQPQSQSPVYTIVYPLSKASRHDKTFGSIGLIYPDVDRYTKDSVDYSCSGKNSNITDPMFGYSN